MAVVPLWITAFANRDAIGNCLSLITAKIPDNAVLENGVRGELAPFPFGLKCTYTTLSGDALVVMPGWGLTIWVGVIMLAGIAAAFAMNRSFRRQR